MAKLTAKQEIFAQNLMKGMSQRDAYRLAGFSSAGKNAIDANASRLISADKFQARLDEMQQAKLISEKVTAHSVTLMLAQVYEDARKYRQIGAAATAAMGIAKLHGLLVDRVEDITRRPTRDPDAPIEIEVEHWLTAQGLLPGPASEPASVGSEPDIARAATHVDGFSEHDSEGSSEGSRALGEGSSEGSSEPSPRALEP